MAFAAYYADKMLGTRWKRIVDYLGFASYRPADLRLLPRRVREANGIVQDGSRPQA